MNKLLFSILALVFTFYSSQIRAQADGTIDNTFMQGDGFSGIVLTMGIQNDGKIVVGGDDLSFYDGVAVNDIARLNSDGTLDNTFMKSIGPGNPIRKIAMLYFLSKSNKQHNIFEVRYRTSTEG